MRFIILIVVALNSLIASATNQFSELIYDGGVKKGMYSVPLELDSVSFSKIMRRLPPKYINTALYRNYIGCWKIQNDSLMLDSILIWDNVKGGLALKTIEIEDIFDKTRTPSGYFANWVSDTLKLVSGNVVEDGCGGWTTRWEHEELVVAENGIIKKRIHKKNKLINKGFGETKIMELLNDLNVGPIKNRIGLEVNYSAYDSKGNPTDCSVKIRRGSVDESTDARVIKAVKRMVLKHKPLPIYLIDGKYQSVPYLMPINPRKQQVE